jgi:hypothetical protein
MSNWRVVKARDDEGNHCIYLQQGSDKSSREFVEPDVMVSLPQQYAAYLEDAEAEVESRNADEDDDQ